MSSVTDSEVPGMTTENMGQTSRTCWSGPLCLILLLTVASSAGSDQSKSDGPNLEKKDISALHGVPFGKTNSGGSGSQASLFHKLYNFIEQLKTVVVQGSQVSSHLTQIFDQINVALRSAQIADPRVNWYLQCLNNCLHIFDDHHRDDTRESARGGPHSEPHSGPHSEPHLGPKNDDGFHLPANVSTESLFNCHEKCLTIGFHKGAVIG